MKKYVKYYLLLLACITSNLIMPISYQCPEDTNSLQYLATCAPNVKLLDERLKQVPADNAKQNIVDQLLFQAIEAANMSAVYVLLQHGADPNQVTNRGTPLTYAMSLANKREGGVAKMYPIIASLLSSKADPTIADMTQKTPFDYLKEYAGYSAQLNKYINLFDYYSPSSHKTGSATLEQELLGISKKIKDFSDNELENVAIDSLVEYKDVILRNETEVEAIILEKLKGKINWRDEATIAWSLSGFTRDQLIELLYFLFILQQGRE